MQARHQTQALEPRPIPVLPGRFGDFGPTGSNQGPVDGDARAIAPEGDAGLVRAPWSRRLAEEHHRHGTRVREQSWDGEAVDAGH